MLVVCACALLVYSFVALDITPTPPTEEFGFKDGNQESSSSPRLVFMVIDAFRLSFLTSSKSPMSFTKSEITKKSAKLFDAYARMPTVTLPRITAYLTGTLPSFGTVLTNLATAEMKTANWISRIQKIGKKVHFFGDDTWIRLLPRSFEKFEGVTSFFVSDYTDVDNNVTRHLDTELSNTNHSWDALILHYLGLDHIGHSLGGSSSKIPEKLKEMDDVIGRIHKYLKSSTSVDQESYLIVCGDHGMTAAGSHGGASPDETRVPVVIWKFGREEGNKNYGNQDDSLKQPPRIEQIDVSSTIFDVFNMPIPIESYGISLINYFSDDEEEYFEKQHNQFRRIVQAKHLAISDICDENCDYSDKFIKSALKKWFLTVQSELIGSASEVPNKSLGVCVFLLLVALTLSMGLWNLHLSKSDFFIFLINITYFASSLIEEEHEIWYYLGSTVVAIRALRNFKIWNKTEVKSIFFLAFLHRIACSYTQSTRRRWIMDSSLLPPSIFSDTLDFQPNNLNTILNEYPIIVILTCSLFWMYGYKQSKFHIILPMVSHFLRLFELTQFNEVLMHFIRLSILPISYSTGSVLAGCLPLLLAIVPVSQILLLLVIYNMGKLFSKLNLGSVEFVTLCMSSFFYTGNSNSLSTLSLTSAYVGLSSYQPILVGLQLMLYTFSGPILFLCGCNASSCTSLLNHLFSYRISSMCTSLICLYIFQNHLFIWSVYSPKVVYDMAHVIFFGLIGLL